MGKTLRDSTGKPANQLRKAIRLLEQGTPFEEELEPNSPDRLKAATTYDNTLILIQ